MRRLVAGLFLVVFTLQSSGTALAATDANGTGPQFGLGAIFGAMEAAVVGSQLYADVTGTQDRYAAMHAPAPHFHKPEHHIDGPALMRAHKVLLPVSRHGIREALRLPPRSELTSREKPRDPRAMRRSTLQKPAGPGAAASMNDSISVISPITPHQRPQNAGSTSKGRGPVQHALALAGGTGIQHWWTYEEQPIPGLGKALLNVGNGNLLVSAMDVNVPEQGINLAFQRVYNSLSAHDANGDDGGDPAIFGNGWTNNFDANIVYNPIQNTITVYDLDGTACTYTSNGLGAWIPCTGEHAQLATVSGSQGCQYSWTKPNGTIYVFQSYGGTGTCLAQDLSGHLVEILSRNDTNAITFAYSWDSSGIRTAEHITEIDADHSDGDSLVMKFGTVGNGINELKTLTKPDGSELQYRYDQYGELVEVDKPGNNQAWDLPNNPHGSDWIQGDLPETYGYASGTYQLEEACGPRCTMAMWASAQNPADGSALLFTYANSQLVQWQVQGVLNFTPDDGTATPLQSVAPTSWSDWNTTTFQYGATGSCGTGASTTTYMCDQDGHATIWTYDTTNRVTQMQRFAVNQWITTAQSWDTSNNLISTTDANSNVMQYGYDASGNMVEQLQPNTNDFTIGGASGQSLSPLSLYSYDTNNNVVAYCDPVWSNQNGKTFVSNPGDNLCPSTGGAARFSYNSTDPNEPFGCLVGITKPGGYTTTIGYGGAGCGTGLPTLVQGASISQFGSNPSRQPTQDFAYNAQGQLNSYDRGVDGSNYYDSWTLKYNQNGNHDNLNTERIENDTTIGTKMLSFTCYYPDGSVFYTETPSQHDADGNQLCPSTSSLLSGSVTPPAQATAHYYDYDGDETKSYSYKGCTSGSPCSTTSITKCASGQSAQPLGTTCKYYDGLDRLVETGQPYDNRSFSDNKAYEFYSFRWMNRYIYDLSLTGSNAALTVSDRTGSTTSFPAYGNLYKTQEYLSQNAHMLGCFKSATKNCSQPGPYSSATWSDVRGTSFDSLDRPIGKYELAYGTAAAATNTYDGSAEAGLLSSVLNAMQQKITYNYDQMSRFETTSFSQGDGYNRTYSYDPDGRTASIESNALGQNTQMSYTYDVDGNELTVTEPTKAQGYDAGSFICNEYYADGMKEYESVGDSAQNYSTCSQVPNQGSPSNDGISQNRIFSYAYSEDGHLAQQLVTWGTNSEPFNFTYAPSGRELTETDPITNKTAYDPTAGTRVIEAKSYSYGNYGRVNGLTLPGRYQQTSLVYDDEDELAGFTGTENGGGGSVPRPIILNARGEMLEDGTSRGSQSQWETQSANGAQVGNGDIALPQLYQTPPSVLEYDLRSNMATCSSDPNYIDDYETFGGATSVYVSTYDAAGRQTATGFDSSNTCDPSQATKKSTYDAENHILNSNIYKETGVATWGPDGRQRMVGTNNPATAHWDDGEILFATNGSGGSAQLYIGKLAVMDYAGNIDVYDRDQTGAEVSSHGYTTNPPWWMTGGYWVDGWSAGSTRTVQVSSPKANGGYVIQFFTGTCNGYFGGQTYYNCPPIGARFEMQRSDGYNMVGGIVQGARTYDPTTGQWLTPDAYAGNVDAPMSQKPFMWNDNNPISYSDPTGYAPEAQAPDGAGGQPLFTDWSLTGETDVAAASRYFTSVDAARAVEGGYAAAVESLQRNLDPHNYDDLNLLAGDVRSAFSEHKLSPWSLSLNYMSATLAGGNQAVSFSLQVLIGQVYLSVNQGSVNNQAEDEFLRYSRAPGQDAIIQQRLPFGNLNEWVNSDISPDESIEQGDWLEEFHPPV